MTLKRRHVPIFIYFYLLCFAVQWAGSYFTMLGVHDWYPQLDKSPLTPPGYVFGIAWTILYVLMAASATRAYAVIQRLRSQPFAWWLIQLLLGLLWSVLFFGHHEVLSGLLVISATLFAVLVTAILFWRVDEKAGALMLPLILWLTFASHLNLYIYLHN
jgi:tryptophan-rich sensory protein